MSVNRIRAFDRLDEAHVREVPGFVQVPLPPNTQSVSPAMAALERLYREALERSQAAAAQRAWDEIL
jgi:hypothetical protein